MTFNLSKLQKHFFSVIWDDIGKTRSRGQRYALAFARLVVAVVRDMREGYYGQRAASLAYTSLVTFVPLLAIAFSVLKGFGVHDALEAPLRAYLAPLGDNSGEVAERLIAFIGNVNVGVLGAVGTGMLLFGVVSMMYKIEYAFNDIWRVTRARSFLRRVRDYLTVIFLAPLSLFLSVAMTASLQHADFAWKWLHLDLVDTAMQRVFATVPWMLFVLAFGALYGFMPNTRVQAVPALTAGLTTAVLWKLLGKAFALFVAGSASYAAIYSVFAVLILFMIWVYAGWTVVLIGASVTYYLQNPSNKAVSRRGRDLSLRLKERIALQACAELGRAFYKQNHGLTLHQLGTTLRMPAMAVRDVADDLLSAGIIALNAGTEEYIPARPFDATTVTELLDAIRAANEDGLLTAPRIHLSPHVSAVVKACEKAVRDKLGKQSLKQLALGSSEQ